MRISHILLEYDRAKTAAAFGQKLLAVAAKDRWLINEIIGVFPEGLSFNEMAKRDPNTLVDAILQVLERGDPTPHKEYSQAIAKMYGNGLSKAEDIVSTLADYLTKFDKLKRKKKIQPPRNDFNRYKSLEDFMDVVDEYPDEEAEAKPEEKFNVKELWRDKQLIVTIPLDVEAACYVGRGTRWCTAGQNNNMYKYYTGADNSKPLYAVIPRQPAYPNEKYQFHFETKQFMNEQDRPIGMEGLAKLVERFPQLKKALQGPAEKFNIQPLISDEYKQIVADYLPEVRKMFPEMIAGFADRAVAYGFNSLREYGIRLDPAAEQAIGAKIPEVYQGIIKLMDKGFWPELVAHPGTERNGDKVEAMLSSDKNIIKFYTSSEAAKMLADAVQQTGQKIHKDAWQHICELTISDPFFRIAMTRIPKLFTAKLQEHGHALQ